MLAVELRCVQRQGKGAVQGSAACADQVACGIVDANAHATRRITGQGQAIAAQRHVGGGHWRCDQWCDVRRDRRGIDAVGLRHCQGCERARRRHQRYLEVTRGIYRASAEHRSAAADGDGGIRFTLAGQHVERVVDGHVGDHPRR
ncbi:hypothetical protein D3C76_895210 [compost metagenome]